MKKIFNKISNIIGKGKLFKILFNLSPMYRRTGGRLIEVSDDLKCVKIKLPLNYKTKNYVGTIYGGHMYSCVDGIYMVQLINILGNSYVVWDKSGSISYKRPGSKTLFAKFQITDEFLRHVKEEIRQYKEKDFNLSVDLTDAEGKVYAEIKKVIYIANKDYYQNEKRIAK